MGAKTSTPAAVAAVVVVELEDREDEMAGRSGKGNPKKKRKVNVPGASSALFEKVTATFSKLKAILVNEAFEAQTQLDAEKKVGPASGG